MVVLKGTGFFDQQLSISLWLAVGSVACWKTCYDHAYYANLVAQVGGDIDACSSNFLLLQSLQRTITACTVVQCSIMDDSAFLWEHAIFGPPPRRNPLTDRYEILHN
jgi:hypothetical protein